MSGAQEQNVLFTLSSSGKELHRIVGGEGEYEQEVLAKKEFEICWARTDRKVKVVTFMITQKVKDPEAKVSASTIEEIGEQIEGFMYRLEQIQLGITSQLEAERSHFELTQSTVSQQTWANIFKMLLVLSICAGQVYMTTSYFSKGN